MGHLQQPQHMMPLPNPLQPATARRLSSLRDLWPFLRPYSGRQQPQIAKAKPVLPVPADIGFALSHQRS
ncbi:MAG: hypothetical protein ACLQHK_06240 [Gallionellaceae bacterium]